MTALADLFVHSMSLPSNTLWFAVPVSLAVAVVYKTLRVRTLRQLPREIALLSAYILAGMGALMLGLWVLVQWVIT